MRPPTYVILGLVPRTQGSANFDVGERRVAMNDHGPPGFVLRYW
jgi:hypothetical protein